MDDTKEVEVSEVSDDDMSPTEALLPTEVLKWHMEWSEKTPFEEIKKAYDDYFKLYHEDRGRIASKLYEMLHSTQAESTDEAVEESDSNELDDTDGSAEPSSDPDPAPGVVD